MRTFLVALAVGTSSLAGTAQAPQAPAAVPPPHGHVSITPSDVKWGPGPRPGMQIAVLSGDPTKPGPFTLRLRFPDGQKVPPHWHPTAEHLTVLQGTFRLGMGEAYDEASLRDYPVGSFVQMPKEVRHFGATRGEVIIQLHAEGPFVMNYVNPADDPAKKTSSR